MVHSVFIRTNKVTAMNQQLPQSDEYETSVKPAIEKLKSNEQTLSYAQIIQALSAWEGAVEPVSSSCVLGYN